MPQYNQKKMCSECPFRAKAPRGWLGPWTIDQIEYMIHTSEQMFLCHKSLDELQHELDDTELEIEAEHCVGFLRYTTSVCKRSRDPQRLAAQERLKEQPDQAVIPPFQFRKYHEKTILLSAKKRKVKDV